MLLTMHMVEEREKKVDCRCVYFSLFVVYSHYITSISHLTSIHFLIHHLQKTSEGGDIESGEHDYDVVWMDGVEGLDNEVRICLSHFGMNNNQVYFSENSVSQCILFKTHVQPGFILSEAAANEEQDEVAGTGKKSLTSSILNLFSYKQKEKSKKEGDKVGNTYHHRLLILFVHPTLMIPLKPLFALVTMERHCRKRSTEMITWYVE